MDTLGIRELPLTLDLARQHLRLGDAAHDDALIRAKMEMAVGAAEDMTGRLIRELFSTGVPVPFECAFACTVPTADCAKIEKALHKAFAPNRVHASREFFKITTDQAIAILELFDIKQEVTAEVNREIDDDLTGEDKASRDNLKRQRRPNLNFIEMGIPIGATITYGQGDNIVEAVISSDKRVKYDGEVFSLTALTQRLKNIERPINPTPYWCYNGKNLDDIYEETYPFTED